MKGQVLHSFPRNDKQIISAPRNSGDSDKGYKQEVFVTFTEITPADWMNRFLVT